MAFPQWLTPAGDLGIVPELEYFQFSLDAYDPNFGNLIYSRVSGVLPEGVQIIPTGVLQGIPISTPTIGADTSEEYTFSLRVKNTATGNVSDRTFNLTITNVSPPIITPKTIIQYYQIGLQGNITANIGDYIIQPISSANAIVVSGATQSSNVRIKYVSNSPAFTLTQSNLRVVSGNNTVFTNAYPISSTAISGYSTRDLGLYFDGSELNIQLQAVEFANSATLSWSITSGQLPTGITLSSSGNLSGIIQPIPAIGPSSDPGWDDTQWDLLGWDFPLGVTSKEFSFTVEVTDGVNYDVCTYNLLVYPKRYFTADSTEITVDATRAYGVALSVDTGSKHYPIITSVQNDLPAERERGYFSFKIDAIDLDDDVLQYAVPSLNQGTYDEQILLGNSVPYITANVTNGNLFTGVFPKTTITPSSTIELFLGNSITANVGQYITQGITNANARVIANVVTGSAISVTVISANTFISGSGNLRLNGVLQVKPVWTGSNWANIEVVPAAVIVGASVAYDDTAPGLVPGDVVQILAPSPTIDTDTWYQGTINTFTNIRVTGNTVISANAGMWLTQEISGANAIIAANTSTVGTISLGGNLLIGTLTISNIAITANAGAIISQPDTGANAYITSNVLYAVVIPISYNSGTFIAGGGNLQLNGSNIAANVVSVSTSPQPISFSANIGDVITQVSSGAVAVVSSAQYGGTSVNVEFTTGNNFVIGAGNISVTSGANVANIRMYPTGLFTQTDIACQYNNSEVFIFNIADPTVYIKINNVATYSTPIRVNSVGIGTGSAATQGDIGYDEGRFDQGQLALPSGLTINTDSGWITGYLPYQSINKVDYDFTVSVYKRDYPGYAISKQFTLTVLGDVNNTIDWLTPSYLGTIENGDVSDISVRAISSKGKTLYYSLAPNSYQRFPQGILLLPNGVLSGRVSFEVFSIDQGLTTLDSGTSTFDNTYRFNITASDAAQTISASKEFTIRVVQRNVIPYENLYLKALLSNEQRNQFQNILQDQDVFPSEYIYRSEDPYYGLAKDIKMLFLPGLNPSTMSHYANVVATNHFNKTLHFGEIKTAIAVANSYDVIEVASGAVIGTFEDNIGFIPNDFSLGYTPANIIPSGTRLNSEHIKYEVVYVELFDDNTNSQGHGPLDSINLLGVIDTPFYDLSNNPYYIAYPNSFENMSNVVVKGPNQIGYLDKGVLPDWMTSKQPDGRILGFTKAAVLAYTLPGKSNTIAYRFQQQGYNLNELNFEVDRYQLDNILTVNYDIVANAFITSKETTFDRYPRLGSIYRSSGTVDYSVNTSFDNINQRTVQFIIQQGGLDGMTTFNDGQLLTFYQQEFVTGNLISDTYNVGWNDVDSVWDGSPWDWDNNTTSPTTDDLGWDEASYVPGYNAYILGTRYPNGYAGFPSNPKNGDLFTLGAIIYGYDLLNQEWAVANQRIGIWRINIDSEDRVTLTFVKAMNYHDSVYVRNGFTHGGVNIYFDPVVKDGKTVPNYSVIPQEIRTTYTTFDGNGTRFLSYRDSYSVPEQGDKYIKFAKNGVFT